MNGVIGAVKAGDTKRWRRREFLLAALASGGLASSYLRGQAGNAAHRDADVRTANENGTILVTPNTDFFVRNHFATPKISSDVWSLEIGGAVSKPLTLSYSDLLLSSSISRAFTLECAGNRSGAGGVSTALWSGLSLGELLQQAGVKPGAITVALHGADTGEIPNASAPTHFVRAIPLEKAMDSSSLLAYEMNGAPLSADHGFPLRAVIPGWYGMDSVKWLTRIEILDKQFTGFFQQEEYVAMKANGERRPLTRMMVNSKILRPSEGEEIHSPTYRIEGAAWAGERKVAKVELRVGPGGAWQSANLPVSAAAMVWTHWSYDWRVPRAGSYTLEVRAADDDGHTQPDVRDPDRRDAYELNTPHRINVSVRI